jgi:hypothetical protein
MRLGVDLLFDCEIRFRFVVFLSFALFPLLDAHPQAACDLCVPRDRGVAQEEPCAHQDRRGRGVRSHIRRVPEVCVCSFVFFFH